jgi:hypothetical protein
MSRNGETDEIRPAIPQRHNAPGIERADASPTGTVPNQLDSLHRAQREKFARGEREGHERIERERRKTDAELARLLRERHPDGKF